MLANNMEFMNFRRWARQLFLLGGVVVGALFCAGSFADASSEVPQELQDVSIEEKLGASVSVDELTFRDEKNEEVALSKYFHSGKPVVLNLVYYNCPNLCNLVLNGFLETLKKMDWTPGNQFEVVTLSINPKEKPDLAEAKKRSYVAALGRPASSFGWHFLTGEESQIKKLADEVGFRYKYDPKSKEYAHAAGIFVLTPEGKMSRYLFGIDYPTRDLKLSLMEASGGKIGNIAEKILFFCYRYDPSAKGYGLYVWRLMRVGSAGTVVAFGGYLFMFWRRQRRRPEEGDR